MNFKGDINYPNVWRWRTRMMATVFSPAHYSYSILLAFLGVADLT